jgi:hypothetical protein
MLQPFGCCCNNNNNNRIVAVGHVDASRVAFVFYAVAVGASNATNVSASLDHAVRDVL